MRFKFQKVIGNELKTIGLKDKIKIGEISAGVILGGESRYKMLKASIENKKYEESELTINPDRYIKAPNDLNLDIEKKELGEMAVGYYAILESAFRAKTKKTLSEQSEFIANLYSHFSKNASNNEFGWIDEPLQKEEIKKESDKEEKSPEEKQKVKKYFL